MPGTWSRIEEAKELKKFAILRTICYDNDMDSPKEETISDILRKKNVYNVMF